MFNMRSSPTGENMYIRMDSHTKSFNPVRLSCNRTSSDFTSMALIELVLVGYALANRRALSGKLDCYIKFCNLRLLLSQMYV